MRIFLVVSLLVSIAASGQSPLPADGSFAAQAHVQYLPDASGQRTLSQVWRDSARFRLIRTARPAFGVGYPPLWLRFRISNPTAGPAERIVELDNPYLEAVRLYEVAAGGQLLLDSGPMGWADLPAHRLTNHRNPLLRFRLNPRQTVWIYGRINNPSQSLRIPIRLWTARDFEEHDRRVRLFWYWLTGVLSWLVFINLVLFILLREWVYGQYSLYMFLVMAYLSVSVGLWLEFLPVSRYGPITARNLLSLLTSVSTVTGFFFIRQYVLLPSWAIRWVRVLFHTAVSLLLFTVPLVILGTYYPQLYVREISWMGPVMSLFFGLPVLLIFVLIGYQAFQTRTDARASLWYSPARLYLLGVAPLVFISICLILRNHALLPDHVLFGYEGVALGYLFEFAVLSIGLGFSYKRTAEERRQLAEETFLQRQQLLESQFKAQQGELRAAQAQLRLQQERERIARDLHDHVGAQLSVIVANAGTPTADGNEPTLIGDYAREAMQSLRDTVWAIDQSALTLTDFGVKLRQYLHRQQQQHPACRYRLDLGVATNPELTSAQGLNLFRQVQEAVHNAFKHAHASEVVIDCRMVNTQLVLSIKDNGVGFDPARQPDDAPHYGLRNLQRRATDLHGTSSIDTAPGHGTSVLITIPLETEQPVGQS